MADYLTATVSASVTEGVAATVAAQPDDPVDFLGRYLLKLVERGETEAKVSSPADATSRTAATPASCARPGRWSRGGHGGHGHGGCRALLSASPAAWRRRCQALLSAQLRPMDSAW